MRVSEGVFQCFILPFLQFLAQQEKIRELEEKLKMYEKGKNFFGRH